MAEPVPHIIVIGSGFAGITASQHLGSLLTPDEAQITLVSKTNHMVFTPMLPEAAAGGLNIQNVTESDRAMLKGENVNLLVAEVKNIDLERRIVQTSETELPFDYLIIASGATTNYFGTPGAEELCLTLKDVHDGVTIKNHLIEKFEQASLLESAEDRKKLLSFAAIGGGPTGIELITELNDLIQETMSTLYPHIKVEEEVSITVIDMAASVLMPFSEKLRGKALKMLEKQGIKVLLNTAVKGVSPEGVLLGDGTILPAATVYWTAGVKPNAPTIVQEVAKDKGGRLTVSPDLSLPNYPNVFAVGDVASFIVGERPQPMLAQVAIRQAPVAAENIVRTIRKQPRSQYVAHKLHGSLCTVGRGKAVADISGVAMWGWPAWLLWHVVYLYEFKSWNRRLKILNEWIVEVGAPRDISET